MVVTGTDGNPGCLGRGPVLWPALNGDFVQSSPVVFSGLGKRGNTARTLGNPLVLDCVTWAFEGSHQLCSFLKGHTHTHLEDLLIGGRACVEPSLRLSLIMSHVSMRNGEHNYILGGSSHSITGERKWLVHPHCKWDNHFLNVGQSSKYSISICISSFTAICWCIDLQFFVEQSILSLVWSTNSVSVIEVKAFRVWAAAVQIVWAAVGHSSFIFSEYFDRFWVFECLRYRKVDIYIPCM